MKPATARISFPTMVRTIFCSLTAAQAVNAFGVFIDFPGKVRYDIGYTEYDALRFATEEPDHELYIITGDDLNAISRQFRQLIGRSYIPPKWAFGLAQSRFGYKTAEDVREVARQYKENDLPLDMICMDIDYMQDYADFYRKQAALPGPCRPER